MEKIVYKKVCANPRCKYGFDFESTSRNTKYCCQECADIMHGKKKAQAKKRKQKRQEYDENKEIHQALNRAYGLSHVMADTVYMIPKTCDICGKEPEVVDGQQVNELHHKDINPFNASPWNMVYLCKSCHKRVHDKTSDINMVETYKEAVQTEDPIGYLKGKLDGIENYDDVKAQILEDK